MSQVGVGGSGGGEDIALPQTTHYTKIDLQKVKAITTWLREQQQSRAWMAKKVRRNSSTVSQVLSCKYPSPPTEILDEMLSALQVETERMGDGTPGYVAGEVHKMCFVVCDRTRKHRNFGVLVGNVGVGKTRTLREVQSRRPQTLMVEANPRMTANSLLQDILEQLRAPVPYHLDKKFQATTRALEGTNYLLIVDEAETLTPQALHYLRRIRDKAGIGIVLSGTPKLTEVLKPEQGQFDQIRSRVSMWPRTITGISRDDADDMVREALRDSVDKDKNPIEPSDEVLEALWSYCGGSARVLNESLLPALRDYVIGRMDLTDKAVHAVARDVLFMEPRKAS